MWFFVSRRLISFNHQQFLQLDRKHATVKAVYHPLLQALLWLGGTQKEQGTPHAQTPFQASKLGNVCAITMHHFHDPCYTR